MPTATPSPRPAATPTRLKTTIDFNSHIDTKGNPVPDADVKDINVDLPPGLVGNPTAVGRCTQSEYGYGGFDTEAPGRPTDSQVGVFDFLIAGNPPFTQTTPVYNMMPPPGVAAEFAFAAATTDARAVATVGPGPTTSSRSASATSAPAARYSTPDSPFGACPPTLATTSCGSAPAPLINGIGTAPCSTQDPHRAFFTLPTSCLGPQTTTMHLDSWPDPGNFLDYSFVSHDDATPPNPIGGTDCSSLDFRPTVAIQTTSSDADSPTGLHAEISLPQDSLADPNGRAEAHLKKTVVDLPAGFTVNPSSADGLQACSPAQIDLTSTDEPTCPDGSKPARSRSAHR